MNALRAPLTALPVPKGICRLFLLDSAGALTDGRLTEDILATGLGIRLGQRHPPTRLVPGRSTLRRLCRLSEASEPSGGMVNIANGLLI